MNKKELIVLLLLVLLLLTINIVNYVRRQNLKKNYVVLVEEASIQLSINSAAARELEDLPGIGRSLAERIVQYREANGSFNKLEDLKKVKGIGDKLFQRLCPYLKL